MHPRDEVTRKVCGHCRSACRHRRVRSRGARTQYEPPLKSEDAHASFVKVKHKKGKSAIEKKKDDHYVCFFDRSTKFVRLVQQVCVTTHALVIKVCVTGPTKLLPR